MLTSAFQDRSGSCEGRSIISLLSRIARLNVPVFVAVSLLGAGGCGHDKATPPGYDEIASVGTAGDAAVATSCAPNPDAAVPDGGAEAGQSPGGGNHVPSGLSAGGGWGGAAPYVWKNVPIRGGGFVSGISFSP